MNKLQHILVLLLGTVIFLSCNKMKPDPKIPAFLHIDSIGVTTDAALQGSSSHMIHDAWVTVDGKSIGVFALPCDVPVLATDGDHEVSVEAGIKVNGISATRGKYRFYAPNVSTVTLTKELTSTISPMVTYESFTTFKWLENFEGGTFSLEKTANCDAGITLVKATGNSAFEGTGSGLFSISSTQTNFEFQSKNEFALPKDDRDIYLEFDFKSTIEFTIGLNTKATSASYREPILTVNPSGEWKKMYVYLTRASELHADAGGHFIYFATTNNGSNNEIYIDNIKVLY